MCAPQTVVGKMMGGKSELVIGDADPNRTPADVAAGWGMGPDLQPLPPEKKPDLTAPDLTDDAIREARSSELLRLKSGQGRRSTFLTGPMGSTGSSVAPSLSAAPAPVSGPLPKTLIKKKTNYFGG